MKLLVTLAAVLVALTACGGADEPAESAATAAPDTTGRPAPADSVEVSPDPTGVGAPDDSVADTHPATTTMPDERPFEPADLPEIVAEVVAARGGAGAPLDAARALGGFPLDVPAPEGSTLFDVTTRFQQVEQGTRETTFQYTAAGPGGNVPDVDITLDGNGPGSAQLIDVYDPVMVALGFSRTASTASDPGEPGGPNSVNHVYVPDEPIGTFNGIAGSAGNVFVWTDEDISGGSFGDEPIIGGYRIDIEIDTSEDDAVPVPVLAALADAFPVTDSMVLTSGELRTIRRSPDAFEIERGELYVAIRLEWEAPAEAFEEIVGFYSDTAVIDAPLAAAEPSFFADGEYEPAELTVYDVTDRRLPILLLDRYRGLLSIDAPDDGPLAVTLDIDLDSVAPVLRAPSD